MLYIHVHLAHFDKIYRNPIQLIQFLVPFQSIFDELGFAQEPLKYAYGQRVALFV
jgi:hypothetical protein